MNWQAALEKLANLDAAKFTPGAKTDLDSLKATLTANLKQLDTEADVTRDIARLTAAPPRLNREQAMLGASAAEQLRALNNEWFNFYNGYDPLFTWWMGMPQQKVDQALGDYAVLLRDKVAAENLSAAATPASATPIAPAAPGKYPDVPDLNEIIALPQDEMRDVVARFSGGGGGRGGGRDASF